MSSRKRKVLNSIWHQHT